MHSPPPSKPRDGYPRAPLPCIRSQPRHPAHPLAVKSKNTTPELIVRRIAHRLGFRFRLHRRDLPGKPDLVFPRLAKIIFVHGCFWHQHACRHGRLAPISNAEYWRGKRAKNAARDRRVITLLRRQGWKVLTVWECQLRDLDRFAARIDEFLCA